MRAPIHLWIVGILSLLWNAGGAYDYLMTQLGNAEYLAMLTEPQRALMDGRPMWFDAAWAFGVWGSIAGSLLLLLRSRFAVTAFGVSILGLAASSVWSFGIAEPSSLEVMGSFAAIFSLAIVVILLALFVYARRMQARGILR